MGKAVLWQERMAVFLSSLPITVNNPRSGHWSPNGAQEAKTESSRNQVECELSVLEKSDVICFFFHVETKSPVTMMELGFWARSAKVVVCCDNQFWRAGNVNLVCERYGTFLVETFEKNWCKPERAC